VSSFEQEKQRNIEALGRSTELHATSREWIAQVSRRKYSYNFAWLGRPIIQFPQDIVAMQEIIWRVQPDLIVETGIAHGGSLIFHASMLELIGGKGRVLGVDIDIRDHNRIEIEHHPMAKRITMIQGSSIDEAIAQQVYDFAQESKQVLVILDSNHTHDHVLRELELYAGLVAKGSYLAVFDTIIEDMPEDLFPDRPWGKGDNPATAVRQFLQTTDRFVVDEEFDHKLLITVAPGGYLRCIK
jgi:cephalosporin hydroxylase